MLDDQGIEEQRIKHSDHIYLAARPEISSLAIDMVRTWLLNFLSIKINVFVAEL